MNISTKNRAAGLYPWSRDLEGSVGVSVEDRAGFGLLLGWLDKFMCSNGLQPGREACGRFWRESVKVRVRENWQLEQWGAALRWYLRWTDYAQREGREHRSLADRVRDAVDLAGA